MIGAALLVQRADHPALDRLDDDREKTILTAYYVGRISMEGIADKIGYFTPEEGNLRGVQNGKTVFRGCAAGVSGIGIDSVGNVRGCESMYDPRFNEGNLREKSLKEIWEDPAAFSYNRSFRPALLTGACASCEMGPYCAGGCRSYNFFTHGKLYESPACARRQAAPENITD